MLKKIEIFISLLIFLGIVILIAQNSGTILIRIFKWEFFISKILLFLLFTVLGFILGVLISFLLVRAGKKA